MTGLIYVILISLWGVVLVPRWLRHHDEHRRRRESERLERALNPHAVTATTTTAHLAADSPESSEYVSWREYLKSLTHRDARSWSQVPMLDSLRSPRGRHARRRRTILVALGGAAGVGLVGAVVGVVPGFVAVLATLLLGGYVTLMVLQMRQWESRRETPAAPYETPTADTAPAPVHRVQDGVRLVGGAADAAAGGQWAPREATPPLYAGKPKASKVPRRIDLTRSGWTGADMVEQARAQQSPALQNQFDREFTALEPEFDEQVDELANYRERHYRRAVNE